MSLDMRSRCERCGAALDDGGLAFICSYECTFCATCARDMDLTCPNCGGELVARPRRPSGEDAVSV
ncbi:MAG: DUF1272 domain-containing protein [Rubrobacteraceae bacterium]|nr:DUF1272 domain-containing protein [Rubrobacteraceae bacterium]